MCITSATVTMSSSLADHQINAGIITEAPAGSSSSGRLHQFMRTSSSLSTASSDFEFDSIWSFSELNDHEPPLSPKLNYSPNWESAGLAATNQNFAERETALGSMSSSNVVPQDREAGLPNEISASRRGSLNDVISVNDGIKEGLGAEISSLRRGLDDVISVNDGIKGDDYGGEQRRRVNLRSLLDRRDVEQLPPLNYKNYSPQMKRDLQVSSSPSPSSSASSSPLHRYCNGTSPCRNDDDHPCTPCKSSRSYEKKCKKWAFNLDFLRRTVPSSSKADNNHHQLNQRCSSDQASSRGLNRRCSSDQASNYGLNQRYASSDLEAAASNYGLIESHGRMAAANEVDDQLNNYSAAAAPAVIRKFDSPRKSTGSSRHAVISSLPKHAGKNYERNVSKSAPISPAASPPRSAAAAGGGGGGGAGAGGGVALRGSGAARPTSPPAHTRRAAAAAASPRWAPMSPHALHYQQQKARAEELRKKTFLPYRQSLLGSCFFPADHLHSTPAAAAAPAAHHHSHAVYC